MKSRRTFKSVAANLRRRGFVERHDALMFIKSDKCVYTYKQMYADICKIRHH